MTSPAATQTSKAHVLERAESMAHFIYSIERLRAELEELGLDDDDMHDIARRYYQGSNPADVDRYFGRASASALEGMEALIERLFAEAPKLTNSDGTPDASQAPAVICHVSLRGSIHAMHGALSRCPEGLLRMLTPTSVQHPGERARTVLLEQFFRVEDVASVMVERETKAEGSRIIGAS